MSSKINLDVIEGFDFVTRLPNPTLGAWLEELPDGQQLELGGFGPHVEIEFAGKRHVIRALGKL